jgi:hypothetical protein
MQLHQTLHELQHDVESLKERINSLQQPSPGNASSKHREGKNQDEPVLMKLFRGLTPRLYGSRPSDRPGTPSA